MEGWIKMYRKLLDNPIASDLEFIGLFTWLLLKANHESKTFYFNKQKTTVERGEFITSMQEIAKHFKISRSKAYRLISILESEHILKHEGNTKFTVIKIHNYTKYQSSETQNETQTIQQTEHARYTNKNDKNDKNLDITNVISMGGSDINRLIGMFSTVNPSYKQLYPVKGQRQALERMINEHGIKKVEWAVTSLQHVVGKPFAPTITTPYELEKKLGSLIAYLQKEQGAVNKFSVTKV